MVTSIEAKERWKKANYKIYHVHLRLDTDKELINYIETHKERFGTTEIFREALVEYIKKLQG